MPFLSGDIVDVDAFAHAGGGPPTASGRLRACPEDFMVEEQCSVAFDGEGEHLWVWIEKTGLTTPQAAERLARAFGVSPRWVGYSGLKDRHAISRQWLSFPWPIRRALPQWPAMPDCRVLETHRHGRKLRRGTHHGNVFRIRIRDVSVLDSAALDQRVSRLEAQGIPNYFGPQRFGRGGANIALSRALFAGRQLSRTRRSFALSAARALLFNAVLDARLKAGTWPAPMAGELYMLNGSNSLFASADSGQTSAELAARVKQHDIHPTGPLPGRIGAKTRLPDGAAGDLESRVLNEFAEFVDGLSRAGVDADRRALRVPVEALAIRRDGADLCLAFGLPPGAYATSAIRELANVSDQSAVHLGR